MKGTIYTAAEMLENIGKAYEAGNITEGERYELTRITKMQDDAAKRFAFGMATIGNGSELNAFGHYFAYIIAAKRGQLPNGDDIKQARNFYLRARRYYFKNLRLAQLSTWPEWAQKEDEANQARRDRLESEISDILPAWLSVDYGDLGNFRIVRVLDEGGAIYKIYSI